MMTYIVDEQNTAQLLEMVQAMQAIGCLLYKQVQDIFHHEYVVRVFMRIVIIVGGFNPISQIGSFPKVVV